MQLTVLARGALPLAVVALTAATPASPGDGARRDRIRGWPGLQSRNDVQVPNDDGGTRFSLVESGRNGPWTAGRLYFTWNINDRTACVRCSHPCRTPRRRPGKTSRLRRRELPARSSYDGDLSVQLVAADLPLSTPPQRPLDVVDRLHREGSRRQIELQQGAVASRKTDTGFVRCFTWPPTGGSRNAGMCCSDVDGLAGGPGRAVDLARRSSAGLNDRWSVAAGYRTVEGGADTDEVYAFAWFHTPSCRESYRF